MYIIDKKYQNYLMYLGGSYMIYYLYNTNYNLYDIYPRNFTFNNRNSEESEMSVFTTEDNISYNINHLKEYVDNNQENDNDQDNEDIYSYNNNLNKLKDFSEEKSFNKLNLTTKNKILLKKINSITLNLKKDTIEEDIILIKTLEMYLHYISNNIIDKIKLDELIKTFIEFNKTNNINHISYINILSGEILSHLASI